MEVESRLEKRQPEGMIGDVTAMKTVHGGLLSLVLTCLAGTLVSQAQFGLGGFGGNKEEPVVRVSTYWSDTGVHPGGQLSLAVVLDVRKPYHITSNKPKDEFSIPTKVELVDPPAELRSSTPVFPAPQQLELGTGDTKEIVPAFTGRTIVYIPMSVTSAAKPGPMDLSVKVSYQACNDKTCLPPVDANAKAQLQVVPPGTKIQKANPELFAGMEALKERLTISFFGWDFKIEPSKLWLLLLVAGVGGVLLNFTPCVLPLVPIKVMGLSHAAGNRRRGLLLGLALSGGVVAFWLGLAAAISSISGFNATNKLFQYPAFTIGVGVVICAMAVGMCGVFALSLPQWVYRVNPSQESMGGSFLFGIMTAVLSTPCTAPFMGAAAAWSATQPPAVTLSTFAAIGSGMALPYLVLSAFPVLVRRMPRTGPASELIKQVMGLFMLAAGAYFLGTGLAGFIAKPPDPPSEAYWWGVSFFVAAAGGWLLWRTVRITPRLGKRLVFGGLGVALVVAAIVMGVRFTKGSPIKWVYYTPQRLAEAQARKRVVVLEFTAAWCINCHFLEQAVLHQPGVVSLLNSNKITPIKVDLTGNNPQGNEKLIEVGRRTIPFLIIYSGDGKQIFASDAYTVEQLTEALKQAERM
jgi:thiol:disulfide interchange protein